MPGSTVDVGEHEDDGDHADERVVARILRSLGSHARALHRWFCDAPIRVDPSTEPSNPEEPDIMDEMAVW